MDNPAETNQENENLKNNNNPNPAKTKENRSDVPEALYDDDNSLGKNSLGENPEQILYNQDDKLEDAKDVISDANEK